MTFRGLSAVAADAGSALIAAGLTRCLLASGPVPRNPSTWTDPYPWLDHFTVPAGSARLTPGTGESPLRRFRCPYRPSIIRWLNGAKQVSNPAAMADRLTPSYKLHAAPTGTNTAGGAGSGTRHQAAVHVSASRDYVTGSYSTPVGTVESSLPAAQCTGRDTGAATPAEGGR